MKKLLSVILSITMLLSSAVIVSADGVDGLKPIEKVKVAINAEFPPFEYYENDEMKGFDIDLMNAIGEKMGFEIEYVNVPFDDILPSLLSGRADCGISAITITEERENNFDFTRPYLTSKTTNHPMEDEEYEEYVNYTIVFPESTYEKSKVLLAAGERSIYAEVNNAIEQLSKDGTIEKLIEKYKLNESLTDGGPIVTHTVANYTPTNNDENKNPATYASSVLYSDWAKSDIEKAISLNIINNGGNYNYTGNITREEFCEIVYSYIKNVLGLEDLDKNEIRYGDALGIGDTDSHAVRQLIGRGIIKGKGTKLYPPLPEDGPQGGAMYKRIVFAPNDYLTREEAATILDRLLRYAGEPMFMTCDYIRFADSADISDWADSAIQVMAHFRIMNGIGDNDFAPKEAYTTEQAIVTVIRVYNAQNKNHIEDNAEKELVLLSEGNTEIKLNAEISTFDKKPIREEEGRGDGFHWIDYSYDDIFVRALIGDDNLTHISYISTTSDKYKTPRDIKVGDTLKKLIEKYPKYLTKGIYDETVYVYTPNDIGFSRIYFYIENDIVTKIVIENGIDG